MEEQFKQIHLDNSPVTVLWVTLLEKIGIFPTIYYIFNIIICNYFAGWGLRDLNQFVYHWLKLIVKKKKGEKK